MNQNPVKTKAVQWGGLARTLTYLFFALYLVWRTIFLVSFVSLDTDAYNKDTFCGSLDTEPES